MNKPDTTTPGGRIRHSRINKDIKVEELAKTIGISSGHLRKIENGQRNANKNLMHKIAQALDVNDKYLSDNGLRLSIKDINAAILVNLILDQKQMSETDIQAILNISEKELHEQKDIEEQPEYWDTAFDLICQRIYIPIILNKLNQDIQELTKIQTYLHDQLDRQSTPESKNI